MDPDRLLLVYMIDLCNKNGWHDSAAALRRDGKVADQEAVPVDSQQGFLSEWWIAFWDLFAARTNKPKNPVAASYSSMIRSFGRGGQLANARLPNGFPPTQPGFPQHHPHMNGVVAVGGAHPAQQGIPQAQQLPGGPPRPLNPFPVSGPPLGGQRMANGVGVPLPPGVVPRPVAAGPGRPGPGGAPMVMLPNVRSGVPPAPPTGQQPPPPPQTPQLGQPPASPQKDQWTNLFFEFTHLPLSEQTTIMSAAGFPDRQPTSLVEADKLKWKSTWDQHKRSSMLPPPVPSHRQPQTPHQTGVNVPGMPAGRGAKRRSPDDPDENADKDGSPSGRKKPRISGAPQTPSAQNMNVNGAPAGTSSTMPPPPLPAQGQQGPPGGGQQQQPSQPQQAQTPQGQLPSTPQNRFIPNPTGLGQSRPNGPLGTMPMPSLAYSNPGVVNGARVSMSGASGVPGTPSVGGPGSVTMIPNTNPMGNQLQAAARAAPSVQQVQGANKPGAQFAFSAMAPGYPHPQPAMSGQPQPGQQGGHQQQPNQSSTHGGAPNNPFNTGPTQPTVSTVKAPMHPPKAPGSTKPAHRTIPGGPGAAPGSGVVGVKKEGASPNVEAKDTKDGIGRSPAPRPASQPSKSGAGAATPSANAGLQPGGPVGGGALSPNSLMQPRQTQGQAIVNQSPLLLGAGVGAVTGGILNGLSALSPNPGATGNASANLPSAGLEFDFNQMPGMSDFFNGDFNFEFMNGAGLGTGLGGVADDTFMFLNMSESMDGNNLLG